MEDFDAIFDLISSGQEGLPPRRPNRQWSGTGDGFRGRNAENAYDPSGLCGV